MIDPKGDLTNLALSFNKLKADEFAPFIDENEMQTLGISRKNLAEQKAQIWQNGLQNSYQSKELTFFYTILKQKITQYP